MQMLAEVTFVLALILPPLAVVVAAGAMLAASGVSRRSRAENPAVQEQGSVALHHPVSR